MHSHDWTMLARMGFQDPDKGSPAHDLACRYLTRPETATALLAGLDLSRLLPGEKIFDPRWSKTEDGYAYVQQMVTAGTLVGSPEVVGSRVEEMLTKGEGKFRSQVGFLDIVIQFSHRYQTVLESYRLPADEPDQRDGPVVKIESKARRNAAVGLVVVEVKIARETLGNCIRQVKLYREYLGPLAAGADATYFVLATAYPIDQDDADTLLREDICHVRLGPKFDRWCEGRKKDSKPAAGIEL